MERLQAQYCASVINQSNNRECIHMRQKLPDFQIISLRISLPECCFIGSLFFFMVNGKQV